MTKGASWDSLWHCTGSPPPTHTHFDCLLDLPPPPTAYFYTTVFSDVLPPPPTFTQNALKTKSLKASLLKVSFNIIETKSFSKASSSPSRRAAIQTFAAVTEQQLQIERAACAAPQPRALAALPGLLRAEQGPWEEGSRLHGADHTFYPWY